MVLLLGHGLEIAARNGEPHQASVNDLRRLCTDLRAYARNNNDAIVSYHRRYHDKRPVSTSRAEGCVDEIANSRMGKKQRMRWSPGGVHRVAVVRAAASMDVSVDGHHPNWRRSGPGFFHSRWFIRGYCLSGLCDQRYIWTHLFAAVQPNTGKAFALLLPEPNTASMQLFLDHFPATLPVGEHAAMVMDQAGWHITDQLAVPSNVSLILLPFHSPELNPVKRVWLFLRERCLSHRMLNSYDVIVDALCIAWNKIIPTRVAS